MLDREYWEFHPEWLEYVKRTWEGRGRVEQIKDDSPENAAFTKRAIEAFKERRIMVRKLKTYLSIQKPSDGKGYDVGYPHIHYPDTATSLIHYLQPGDKPSTLDVFENGHIVERITPEKALTVFMPHKIWHGVYKNHGFEDRILLIATTL